MTNDSDTNLSEDGPSTDSISLVDVDGDCVPDYIVVNIRWLLAAIFSSVAAVVGYVI